MCLNIFLMVDFELRQKKKENLNLISPAIPNFWASHCSLCRSLCCRRRLALPLPTRLRLRLAGTHVGQHRTSNFKLVRTSRQHMAPRITKTTEMPDGIEPGSSIQPSRSLSRTWFENGLFTGRGFRGLCPQ